jgi:hypothetical protein
MVETLEDRHLAHKAALQIWLALGVRLEKFDDGPLTGRSMAGMVDIAHGAGREMLPKLEIASQLRLHRVHPGVVIARGAM